jgi:cation:H+ antiporter
MLLHWLLIIAGLAALVAGAEALVRGASGIALLLKLSPAVIGLTVIAAGTSMPELVVSVKASLSGNPGLAIGNVVGSNLLNIGLVLGLTALTRPLRIVGNTIKFEWPVLMLATFQFYLLARDGRIDRVEGGFLVGVLLLFMAYAVWLGRRGIVAEDGGPLPTVSFGRIGAVAAFFNITAVIIGATLLAVGANALVKGAVAVAGSLGVSDTIIGLTVVAFGTSAPELITSVVAALRGRDDMAVGNIVGSSIFNLLAILGVAALFRPLPIPPEIMTRDIWWLIGATAMMFPMMITGRKVARIEGLVLLGGFITYTVFLILGN